jgi:hypothetical protein
VTRRRIRTLRWDRENPEVGLLHSTKGHAGGPAVTVAGVALVFSEGGTHTYTLVVMSVVCAVGVTSQWFFSKINKR